MPDDGGRLTGAQTPMSVLDTTQLALTRAISGATLRGAVLANNIANADTAGFQPSDVDFHAALAGALGKTTPPAGIGQFDT